MTHFVFLHHEAHGPVELSRLSTGTQMFAGSVARLRILFTLARLGHSVDLVGNVVTGELAGVRATEGFDALVCLPRTPQTVAVLNNPPRERDWPSVSRSLSGLTTILWAGNPVSPVWMERVQGGEIARIVCVSDYHRELYRVYRGFDRVECVYSGTDLDLMAAVVPQPEVEGAVFFASVPRRTKGLQNLLAAWRDVRARVPGARLRIAGSALLHDPNAEVGATGILDREMEAAFPDLVGSPEALRSSGVELLGAQPLAAMFAEMKASGVVVVNCNWAGSFETFCRAAVEAQAAGAPVIGAARGSLPEVVRQGETGILVSKADPTKLADAIVRILGDRELRAAMAARGPIWIRPFADYGAISAEWDAVARRALAGTPAPAERRWSRDALRRIGYGDARVLARRVVRGD